MMLLIRTFLIISALHILSLQGELSTIERIKKHREWLRQRGLLKPQHTRRVLPNEDLWKKISNGSDDPRKNDVYPENENSTVPSTTTSTTYRSTSSTEVQIPTTPTTPFPVTKATMSSTNTTESVTFPTPTTSIESTTGSRSIPTSSSTEDPQSTSTTTLKPRPKTKAYPRWSNWSQWSTCSRTCGGGVMWQERKCISRRPTTGKRYVSNDCIGIYRRYHLCNEQLCPSGDDDFRQQQCSSYNDVDFQGQKYVWEPYIKDDAECELNCKPVGMKYFATLNSSVVDGTACFRPAEYYRSNYRGRAICVGGICKVRCVLDFFPSFYHHLRAGVHD